MNTILLLHFASRSIKVKFQFNNQPVISKIRSIVGGVMLADTVQNLVAYFYKLLPFLVVSLESIEARARLGFWSTGKYKGYARGGGYPDESC